MRPGVDFKTFPEPFEDLQVPADAGPQSVVLGGGCFWCTEGVFEQAPGVIDVVSGYAGGTPETATYRAVCGGDTDHAEVIRVTYDPKLTSLGKLLKLFFAIAHDPTTRDRQGHDTGRQYRSAIFYTSDEQERIAEETIAAVDASRVWPGKVVTEVVPAGDFWEAEPEHQDYLERYPDGYTCHFVRPNWKLRQ
jgi:peptide-methionine (S)-S-oxide reductase